MLYTKAWADTVFHHHSGEERIFFPAIEELAKQAGVEHGMEGNVAQHHAFEEGIKETMSWCEDVSAGKKTFDAKVLISMIDSFAPILTQHLHDEIDTLIKLDGKCDGKKVAKLMAETAQAGIKTADVVRIDCI